MQKTIILLATLLFTFLQTQAQTDWVIITGIPDVDYYSLHQLQGGNELYVAGQNGTHLRSDDFFETNIVVPSNVSQTIRDFHTPASGNWYLCTDGGKVLLTTNVGAVWTDRSPPTSADLNYIGSRQSGTAMVVGDGGVAFFTDNFGEDWVDVSPSAFTTDVLNYILSPVNGALVYVVVGDNGILLKTIDSGANWSQPTISTTENLFCGVLGASNRSIIGGDKGVILYTDDFGDTWTETAVGTDETLLAMAHREGVFSDIVACGTNGSLFRSEDNGETWNKLRTPTTSDLHGVYFGSIVNDNIIVVGKDGTILRSDSPSVVVGLDDLEPNVTDLKVFPNPSRDKINISFDLVKGDLLALQLYNAFGQLAQSKEIGMTNVGERNFELELSNAVSNGLYTIIIRSSQSTAYRKIIVQR